MRLSASSFAGTARTLVAVGTVSETFMFLTTAADAPRSGDCLPAATGAAGVLAAGGAGLGPAAGGLGVGGGLGGRGGGGSGGSGSGRARGWRGGRRLGRGTVRRGGLLAVAPADRAAGPVV